METGQERIEVIDRRTHSVGKPNEISLLHSSVGGRNAD